MIINGMLGRLVKKEWSDLLLIEVNEIYMGEVITSWFFPAPEKAALKNQWAQWDRSAFIGFDDGVPF